MARPRKYKTEAEKREARRQRERIKRANETPLERDHRLMKLSLNEWKRRRSETVEQRSERLKRLSLNARKRRAKETAEERANRLRKLSESEMRRRARETSEERKRRLKKLAEYAKNKRTSESNCPNTQVAKMARGRKQTANGIKITLTNCYDDQENHYLEEMHHDPEKFQALVEKSGLNSIPTSQLRCVETRKLQKVSVGIGANRKKKTKTTTRAQRNQLISVYTSNKANSKLCKTRTNAMFHSVSSEILLHPQSDIPPVQEKRILVVPNHQTAVMSNLFSMWKAGRLCDSYISNGTTNILVHKMVLGAVCPKLLPALHHSLRGSFPKVVFPSSVSKEGLLAFAEYMYSGILDLNEEILVQLKTIAEKLEMKDFEDLCCKELNKAKTKDILSGVVEPLLAEPCSLSGLFPSKAQGDTNKNSMLMKLFRNNYSNINMQADVAVTIASTSTSNTTSVSDVRSAENMVTDQIVDIKTEVEPEIESAINPKTLQLKMEPCSPEDNQSSIEEEFSVDIHTSSYKNNVRLKPAASTTHENINKDNVVNIDSSDSINISDTCRSEETCIQHSEDCDKDSDNQKELQLISVTSATENINEDSLSDNSDVIKISSMISSNTKLPQPSNSGPYPISFISAHDSKNINLQNV
ncbi:uncharacterized protein LOC115209550 [Octopus sinensis]|uniref:Uncharacterized protein LOC115209550 n=1 Tax=Octopus sinensis TaxID=2607531 RepID=A0A7E6EPT4_9MOLL|nr:uncharacterized protein LOC115209550 [Octopus sinensis]